MPAIVLIGAQWGDEGKGKATDLLGEQLQWVVRYQGGNNAGHTVFCRTVTSSHCTSSRPESSPPPSTTSSVTVSSSTRVCC